MSFGGDFNKAQLEELCQAIAFRIASGEHPGVLKCESMEDARAVVKRTAHILAEWGIGRPGGEYERISGPNDAEELYRRWYAGELGGLDYLGVDMGKGESWNASV